MKIKHNKKRNTAFVYESLIREATIATLKNDIKRKNTALSIVRRFFKSRSLLKQDLNCYRALSPHQNLNEDISEKILKEAKLHKRLLDAEGLFDEQTDLINTINRELAPNVFSNFVPNYKTLATISQIFSDTTAPKNKILLEHKIVKEMSLPRQPKEKASEIDGTVYKLFAEKFNKKYENNLLAEQKELLTHYVVSFSDNAVSLKVFLNEEVARLKKGLQEAKTVKEIKDDPAMVQKTERVIARLNEFFKPPFNDEMLLTIMKTQALLKEISSDDD